MQTANQMISSPLCTQVYVNFCSSAEEVKGIRTFPFRSTNANIACLPVYARYIRCVSKCVCVCCAILWRVHIKPMPFISHSLSLQLSSLVVVQDDHSNGNHLFYLKLSFPVKRVRERMKVLYGEFSRVSCAS